MTDQDDYHDTTGRDARFPPGWAICALAVVSVTFWVCVFAVWVL
jgi:hypothetical protein